MSECKHGVPMFGFCQKCTREISAQVRAERETTMSSIDKFNESEGVEELDPLERLRYFCSIAMSGDDWLEVGQFFDDINNPKTDSEVSGLIDEVEEYISLCRKMDAYGDACRLLERTTQSLREQEANAIAKQQALDAATTLAEGMRARIEELEKPVDDEGVRKITDAAFNDLGKLGDEIAFHHGVKMEEITSPLFDLIERLARDNQLLLQRIKLRNDELDKAEAEVERLKEHLKNAASLLRDVVSGHADKQDTDYNECDINPCLFCEESKVIIEYTGQLTQEK